MPKHAVIEVRKPEVGSPYIAVWFSKEIEAQSVRDVIDTLAVAGRPESLVPVDGGFESVIVSSEASPADLISRCESLRLGIQHHLGFNAHVSKSATAVLAAC